MSGLYSTTAQHMNFIIKW